MSTSHYYTKRLSAANEKRKSLRDAYIGIAVCGAIMAITLLLTDWTWC